MSEKRPNVFQTNTNLQEKQDTVITNPLATEPKHNVSVDSDYDSKKLVLANEIYDNSLAYNPTQEAVEAMRKRTEEQIRLRDEMLSKSAQQGQVYQEQFNKVNVQPQAQPQPKVQPQAQPQPKTQLMSKPTIVNSKPDTNEYIQQLSQPQFNTAFDVITLPSEGKIYKNKKSSVKVAYMTTGDENILTSPNLLQNGQFLEILINRKLLDTNIRYRDLHVGDRNAIMLWLRATAYGEMYPAIIYDENDEPFETEIDLTTLKTKKLGAEPDEEGYFDFFLPISKVNIKFKLLSVGDVEDIEIMLEKDKKNENPINNTNSYRLEKQIVEVNGSRDENLIKSFVENMRIGDSKKLKQYVEKIESGVDLNIKVTTPGGGSIETFLPLNFRFFWPDAKF